MLDPEKTLALAEEVSRIAEGLGIRTALIGATALAVHGYSRATDDIDLAVAIPNFVDFRNLAQHLESAGLGVELRLAEDVDDPLGGVLAVWIEDEGGNATDLVEVVNFINPHEPAPNPGAQAIARATMLVGLRLHCASLADLVALKVYAGGLNDLADVVEVLALNPDADLEAIRVVAANFDRAHCLDELFERVRQRRMGR